MDWIDEVIQDVAELDYNSPVDQPSVMLVKASELRAIIEARAPKPAHQPDTRKPCTCDGAGRGPGRVCVVKAGGRLGELWRCAEGAEPTPPPIAASLDTPTWRDGVR